MQKLIVLFLMLTIFAGCENNVETVDVKPIDEKNVVGNWRIETFKDDDDDDNTEKSINQANRASLFEGVTIQFNDNKTFVIRKNGNQIFSGTWKISRDDDDDADEIEFDINENTSNPYDELEDDDWEIVKLDASNLWFSEDDDNDLDDEFRLVKI